MVFALNIYCIEANFQGFALAKISAVTIGKIYLLKICYYSFRKLLLNYHGNKQVLYNHWRLIAYRVFFIATCICHSSRPPEFFGKLKSVNIVNP